MFAAIGHVLAVIGIITFFIVSAVIGFNGCEVSTTEAVNAINGEGMSKPALGAAHWFACEHGEASREFTAQRDNRRVTGTVCCGLFAKSCTIRW